MRSSHFTIKSNTTILLNTSVHRGICERLHLISILALMHINTLATLDARIICFQNTDG